VSSLVERPIRGTPDFSAIPVSGGYFRRKEDAKFEEAFAEAGF